jgi:hypothetical protein
VRNYGSGLFMNGIAYLLSFAVNSSVACLTELPLFTRPMESKQSINIDSPMLFFLINIYFFLKLYNWVRETMQEKEW